MKYFLISSYLFVAVGWSQKAPDLSSCQLGPEWGLRTTVEGRFLKGDPSVQSAKLFVLNEDDASMAAKEYRAILTLEKGNDCLLKQEGLNDAEGTKKLPTENSLIYNLPVTDTHEVLRIVDSYSHGFTQETTYLLVFEKTSSSKVAAREVWKGTTYSIDPTGLKTMSPLFLKIDKEKNTAVATHKQKGKIHKWIWNENISSFSKSP